MRMTLRDTVNGVMLPRPVVFVHEGGGKPRRVCDACLADRDRDGLLEHADRCPAALSILADAK